jgi:hypothetical protein
MFLEIARRYRARGEPEMVFGGTRSIIFGLVLAAASACAGIALGQSGAPITPEERLAAERAALSDQRVTAIVGRGQFRLASSDIIVDKGEAERFLEGISAMPPTRRVIVVVLNIQTNKAAKAARALVALSPRISVLAVESIAPADVPLVRDDADQALALAKSSAALRGAVGETLDQYRILDSGSEERVPFAVQVLPLGNSNPNDACSMDRCLDLIFRTENGYLPLRAHVDLTRRSVTVEGGGQRR